MFSLVEYGLGKMLVGIGSIGDKLTDFTYDELEEESELEYVEVEEPKEIHIEVEPYKRKLDCLTYLDKYFTFEDKAEGVKYYVLDKIKSFNYNTYDMSGVVHDDKDHIVSIELDANYQIKKTTCTCEHHNCKHVYALVLNYVDKELYGNNKIYYMFKTKYLLTQFRNLYNLILENIDINSNEDLIKKINCYDMLINNYSEKSADVFIYNEIKGHYTNLKDIIDKLDKDLYNKLVIEVEFIDHDICADFYKELVNEDYIEDIILDKLDY